MSEQVAEALERLTNIRDPDIDREQRLATLRWLRQEHPELMPMVEERLVLCVRQVAEHLREARTALDNLAEQHRHLTQPPWLVATFIEGLPDVSQALVQSGTMRRLVHIDQEVALNQLQMGDEVLLNGEQNLLIQRAPWGATKVGEVGQVQDRVDSARAIVESRGQEVVADLVPKVRREELSEGDTVLYQKDTFLVLEKIERAASRRFLLDTPPVGSRSNIGGLGPAFQQLTTALTASLVSPELATKYDLHGRKAVLLVGPPGCGKTLMARTCAAEIGARSDRRCRFAVVKPAEWESPLVGSTQANIRDCFDSLRQEAAQGDLVVLFLDEVESISRARGRSFEVHNDKFVAAFLAELDGFSQRGNVAIIAATNRKDLLDPAILERLSDVEIRVPRPNRQAAAEIFGIHLGSDLPYSPNGDRALQTRDQIVQAAVSQLFDPNSGNTLCHARLRDGSTRTVASRDLISGRLIAQICHEARSGAMQRELATGQVGLRLVDIEAALRQALERLRTVLTPGNIHSFLDDLPQDVAVASVDPVPRSVHATSRFVNLSE